MSDEQESKGDVWARYCKFITGVDPGAWDSTVIGRWYINPADRSKFQREILDKWPNITPPAEGGFVEPGEMLFIHEPKSRAFARIMSREVTDVGETIHARVMAAMGKIYEQMHEKILLGQVHYSWGPQQHYVSLDPATGEIRRSWQRKFGESLIAWGERLNREDFLDDPDIRWKYQQACLNAPVRLAQAYLLTVREKVYLLLRIEL